MAQDRQEVAVLLDDGIDLLGQQRNSRDKAWEGTFSQEQAKHATVIAVTATATANIGERSTIIRLLRAVLLLLGVGKGMGKCASSLAQGLQEGFVSIAGLNRLQAVASDPQQRRSGDIWRSLIPSTRTSPHCQC